MTTKGSLKRPPRGECVHCGAVTGPANPAAITGPRSVYCITEEECRQGYFEWLYWNNSYEQDGHLIWTGPMESSATQGVVPVFDAYDPLTGKKSRIRARRIGFMIRGETPGPRRNILPDCGVVECVRPEHMIIANWEKYIPAVRLNAAPIVRYYEWSTQFDGRTYPEVLSHRIAEFRRLGHVRLLEADEICIDHFGLHPTALYGDEFYKDAC